MATSLPFFLASAFTTSPFGGNPAVTIFLKGELPTETMQKLATTFNQPMVSYITEALPSSTEKVAAFGIRWFTPSHEVPLCGHATLVAAKVILQTGLVSKKVEVINLHTQNGVVVSAIKGDGEWLEVQLPANIVEEVTPEDKARVSALVADAVGKPDVAVKNVLKGGKGMEHGLLIELDEKENLGGIEVDPSKLLTTGWDVNVITTACTDGSALFVSRMFAPMHLKSIGGEDHVCGSAHCMLTPYWSRKLQFAKGGEMKARQVSKRGGDIKVAWDEEREIIRLMGQVVIYTKGEVLL
ncbi:hypothetical protein HGRIS_008359 [Hohenbuehelia grisea]|uniref:Diaminopimelate epimerase-like protein n=1 Tax=Hohenbuehelia grisea TaxID=104357 RepID=A0ABR3J7P8_9AGAR